MSLYQTGKVEVERLVSLFASDSERFRHPSYNEEQVRIEFINPLFRALGWSVENSLQVVHEDRVIVDEGGEKRVKHPDYGFRTGRDIRFYVEAKKPSVNLQQDPDPAYQVRRYGWSRSLPLSALTDFEEFIVYNCLQQPSPEDGAHVARLRYLTYDKYLDEWDDLFGLFSYDAVLDGALERYVEEQKPKGTVTVDNAFLQELERWREMLAKDIAERNRTLTHRQLNIAVQQTIDRLVFLRITEDRNIEPYGRLNRIAQNHGAIYNRLKQLYAEANDKYNSGLFHFTDDEDAEVGDSVSLKIGIGDDTLRDIVTNLYYPQSPYEFSVLPADILGQVYERFLGSVIVLDNGSAHVDQKPEVRKAGGVYYTPTYIVDYIVENTVGKLVEGKNPNQVSDLRILDPACGSGSFLIGAYQCLIDWHVDYYAQRIRENPNSTYRNRVRETGDLAIPYALTTDEKKRILLNNLYGVDLDQQAVEVSKLSLLLKMLEGETASTATQYAMFGTDEQLLPDLANNVKWGNSLIGSDFYDGDNLKQLNMFDPVERDEVLYKVKVFDWESKSQGFGDILQKGGFDAVIGNPPYIRIQTMKETAPETVTYYSKNYASASRGNYDIYVVFVERGLQLLNVNGILGFILPHKFFNAKYGEPLRGLIAQGKHLAEIVHFGDAQVFLGASTYTCLLFLDKVGRTTFAFASVENLRDWQNSHHADVGDLSMDEVNHNEWNFVVGKKALVYDKLLASPVKLSNLTKPFVGLQTSADTVFLFKEFEEPENEVIRVFSKADDDWLTVETTLLKPVIRSGNIGRYWSLPTALVLFPYEVVNGRATLISQKKMEMNFPKTWYYLQRHEGLLSGRESGKFAGEGWYQLYPKNLDLWEQSKIMMPYMITDLSAYLDRDNMYFVNVTTGGFGITFLNQIEQLEYFTGLLNSRLLDFYLKIVSTNFRGGYFAANKQFLDQLPIRTINFDKHDEKIKHDQMVRLVQTMLDLHKQLPQVSGAQKRLIEQQVDRTDREIDSLVYELYGLTDEEIAIVEEDSK